MSQVHECHWMSANLILQALPDLQKFMDSIHGRIMSCHKLSQTVENDAGDTPAGKESLSIEHIPSEYQNLCFYRMRPTWFRMLLYDVVYPQKVQYRVLSSLWGCWRISSASPTNWRLASRSLQTSKRNLSWAKMQRHYRIRFSDGRIILSYL